MLRNESKTLLALSLGCLVVSGGVSGKNGATEFSAESTSMLGQDSNPFRLNQQFNPGAETFFNQELRFQWHEKNKWRIRLDGEKRNYLPNSDANTLSWGISARYQPDWELLGGDLRFSLAYKESEKHYVSRSTGTLFSRNGQDASNRYNYSRFSPEILWSRKINKDHDISVKWTFRDQSYDDLTSLGLSNLDYQQHSLRFGWDYDLAAGWQLKSSVTIKRRDYDDKRAKSLEGQDIPGSSLEYDYLSGKLDLRYKVNKRHRLFAAVSIEDREDNGGDYYNTLSRGVSFGSRHRFENKLKLNLKAGWTQLQYDRDNPGLASIEEDIETPGTHGWQFQLDAEYPIFRGWDLPVYWVAEVRYWDIASELTSYQYNRSTIATGIRIEF